MTVADAERVLKVISENHLSKEEREECGLHVNNPKISDEDKISIATRIMNDVDKIKEKADLLNIIKEYLKPDGNEKKKRKFFPKKPTKGWSIYTNAPR